MNRLEQETIVLFNEAEPHASVYTYNGALKRKLSNLAVYAQRKHGKPKTTETAA